ncbi:hypothetical protein EV424DRAFT_1419962, partial [Suillus variegatus]
MAFLVYLMDLAFSSRSLPAPAEVGTANITEIQWPLTEAVQSEIGLCYLLQASRLPCAISLSTEYARRLTFNSARSDPPNRVRCCVCSMTFAILQNAT